jgi:hypothetical protein
MKVLKKRIARLERTDGSNGCRGCFLLLVRRTIWMANQPDIEETLPEDDPTWLLNRPEQHPASEEPAKESRTIIVPTAPEEPDEQPSYQRPEPDWRAMPPEMQLDRCPVCGEMDPMSTIHALRQFLGNVGGDH